MNTIWFGAGKVGSTNSPLGGAGITCTLAAIALGAAATPVIGGILDFESLPYPTYYASVTGGMVYDPLGSYGGFKFSSENFFPPGSSSLFANVWFDYTLTSTPSYNDGYVYGINGARALGVPLYNTTSLSTFSIERENGGEWMFAGAQFTRVVFTHPTAVFRMVGWRDGAVVYDISTLLPYYEQLSFGAQVDAIAVDKVVMTFRHVWPNGTVYSTWFTMDDMHYELVPAPGALVLFSMCGLLRRRQRA